MPGRGRHIVGLRVANAAQGDLVREEAVDRHVPAQFALGEAEVPVSAPAVGVGESEVESRRLTEDGDHGLQLLVFLRIVLVLLVDAQVAPQVVEDFIEGALWVVAGLPEPVEVLPSEAFGGDDPRPCLPRGLVDAYLGERLEPGLLEDGPLPQFHRQHQFVERVVSGAHEEAQEGES